MSDSRLQDSVALVIGGAGDIGLAIAAKLIECGAHVVIADVDLERATEAITSLGGARSAASAVGIDLADPRQCGSLVEQTVRDHGSLATVVNCAAVTRRGLVSEISQSDWDRIVAVNLSAVFWTCKAAIEHMEKAGDGVIVNVGSIAGLRGLPGSPAYAATKGGVIALSRALAIDYAASGVRVHVVNPPAVDTPLFRAMFANENDPVEARRRFEAGEGAGRVLKREEIAALVAFLAEGNGPVYSPEPLVT
jgi:NAD(P)-dependent dehydrogenase (short-subunit alcohol dehydrogenase family)